MCVLSVIAVCSSFVTDMMQAGPMEEGIAPVVASERLTVFQVRLQPRAAAVLSYFSNYFKIIYYNFTCIL